MVALVASGFLGAFAPTSVQAATLHEEGDTTSGLFIPLLQAQNAETGDISAASISVTSIQIITPPEDARWGYDSNSDAVWVEVTSNSSSSRYDNWVASRYRWVNPGNSNDHADWFCAEHEDNEGSGSHTVEFAVELPSNPAWTTLEVQPAESVSGGTNTTPNYTCSDTGTSGYLPNATGLSTLNRVPDSNDDLPPLCGMNVLIILDESNSIYNASAIQYVRDGVESFLDSLKGTGSIVAVTEFNDDGRLLVPWTTVTDANITGTFMPAVNNNYFTGNNSQGDQGGTNWQAGLQFAHDYMSGTRVPELVLFFTDGNPTWFVTPDDATEGPGGAFVLHGLNQAAAVAREIKQDLVVTGSNPARGPHMFGIGVGDLNGNESSFVPVTGPDAFDQNGNVPLSGEDDYTVVERWPDLADGFRTLALAFCQSSITLSKYVDNDNDGVEEPVEAGAGWTFQTTVDVPSSGGTDYTWKQPVSGRPGAPDNLGKTQSATTDASSAVTFQWLTDNTGVLSKVAFTETAQSEYLFKQANCVTKDLNGNEQNLAVTDQEGWLTTVFADTLIATCDILNVRMPKLEAQCVADSFDQSHPDADDPFMVGVADNIDSLAQANDWTMTIELPTGANFEFETARVYTKVGPINANPTNTFLSGLSNAGTCGSISTTSVQCNLPVLPANNSWYVQIFVDQTTTGAQYFAPTVVLTNADGEPIQGGSITNTACSVTTPVTLSYFKSSGSGGNVDFEWSTATETNNVGFYLYTETADGRVQVNEDMVLSQVGDSVVPQHYSYSASGVAGTVFYIEDVDAFMNRTMHGPYALGETIGDVPVADPVDWPAIQAESSAKATQRTAIEAGAMNEQLAAVERPEVSESVDLPFMTLLPMATGQFAETNDDMNVYASDESSVSGLGEVVNLIVDQTGMYKLTFEEVAALMPAVQGIAVQSLSMANRGEAVSIKVESGDAVFNAGDAIYFYGEAEDSLYTNSNVYTLRVDKRLRSSIGEDTAGVPDAAAASYYMETASFERNQNYQFLTPNGDPWVDTRMQSYKRPAAFNYPVTVDNVATGVGATTVAVSMWGASEWPGIADNHHIVVSLNGTEIGNEVFGGVIEHDVNYPLPAEVALAAGDGANTLSLRMPNDMGATWDIINLDKYSLTYPRAFVARDGALSFTAQADKYQVTGLTSANVDVYKLVDGTVKQLSNVQVQSDGAGGYAASFNGRNREATFWVVSDNAYLSANIATMPANSDITTGKYDYLVIAHQDFVDDASLAQLVDYHSANGLSVNVVDVRQVYQQFSGHVVDAQAIQDYISYAVQSQGVKAVLLVGGDTYDYKNYLGGDSISFIPSLYTSTGSTQSFAPVDPLYGDVNGDMIPDVAIGRFPVRSSGELTSIVNKTLAYAGISYPRTAVFASGTNFSSDSQALWSALPEGWQVTAADMDVSGLTAAKTAFVNSVNNGVAWANYVGHSGPTVWNYDGGYLFLSADAAALANHDKPTVLAQWGCWNTYYIDPAYNTLSHKLLFNTEDKTAVDNRGAAAVLGATGVTNADHEQVLGEVLVSKMFESDGVSIGDALTAAKQDIAANHYGYDDVILGWTLLGDPMLIVQQ